MGQLIFLDAQPVSPRFENISIEQGLSQRFVLEVLTDCKGFLWVATEDGLNRYDGYEFKVFRHDPEDPNSLGGNILRQALESHALGKHKIWVCTVEGGLSCLDLETETFTNYLHDPLDSTTIASNSVWIVEEATFNGIPELWVGVVGGLDRLNYETGEFQHYDLGSVITALYQDSKGTLWVGTSEHGLQRYIPGTDSFISYVNDPADPTSLSWNNVDEILEDKYGTLWVGTFGGGLNRMDAGATRDTIPRFTHFVHDPHNPRSISGDAIEYLYEDRFGNFWITSSGGGLDILNRETSEFTRYPIDKDNSHHIGSDIIFSACEDNSNVLWFGHVDGLSKWDPQKAVFTRYDNSVPGLDELMNTWISSVKSTRSDQGDIVWIGTIGKGLCKLNRNTGKMTWYQFDHDNSESLAHNKIMNVIQVDPSTLLIGTARGLCKFDTRTEKFSTYHFRPDHSNAVYDDMMFSMARGPSGRIWIGTANTVVEFDLKTERFRRIKDMRAYAIHEAQVGDSNYLWAGGFRGGLLRINLESGEEVWYQHDRDNIESIASNLVDALLPTTLNGTDVLWVGTMDGLDLYDYQSEKFIHYSMADGLPHNHVNSIVEDNNGHLWITTKKGLSQFDPIKKSFKTYWKENGLPGNGYEFNSGYCNEMGEIFIGGTSGLASFFPDSLVSNPIPPKVVLTDFKISHKSVPVNHNSEQKSDGNFYISRAIYQLDELSLSHREQIISFTFAALDFRSPMQNKYAYFMDGFEDSWNYTDASNREATYTNLDPGNYVFRVKASNNDGVWSEDGIALSIMISPPWWETQWAYLGYIVLFCSIVFSIWRFQISKVRLTHQLELEHLSAEHYHELDEHKSRFMANISHEFRTPLTLILGPVANLLGKLKDPELRDDLKLIKRQANRLLELVVQLLDISKLEDNQMFLQASQQNIVPLLKGLVLSFASLAERNNIDLQFEAEDEDIQLYVEREAMVKIFNNLLSNAFKFTENGKTVKLNVSINAESSLGTGGEVMMRVSDTGIGIPEDHLDKVFDRFHQVDGSETRRWGGTGIGLSLTRELVELHKGTITVESKTDTGTIFTIRLPLGKDHLESHEIVELGNLPEAISPVPAEQVPQEHGDMPLRGSNHGNLPTLLIVEDNEDVRNYIRSYLDKSYKCYEAVDGQDGLNKVKELIPDLVISDIMMPRMNGLEFCRQLKTDELTSHIPVLMLTAKADMDSKIKGLEMGADAYLLKPFEAAELKIRIKNLIDQRQALRERFQKEYSFIPSDLDISSMDKHFLERTVQIISDRLGHSGFNVDALAQKTYMSRQQLNRKLKALTGRTASEFIRLIRLKRAIVLLGNNHATITEISYQVGFSNPSHFSRSFHQEYGKTPSAFLAEERNGKIP